ncbi:MAG: RNA methyltransferase, TrmH family [candidate division WS6 bacterium GW2011_GWA2_37_6]|uniref:RNA methyltransferase, TrmH family n=1 Tax=candidate division WS6 bacterium GW2011_GWA2_37_6 TaxID=1619087 RepID=A0A0G0JEX7_9BACT|nr:MAG: RNA methyltransferase, TrmH family [candidate division WS6 bacterium GW2011_GWA2_37_6]
MNTDIKLKPYKKTFEHSYAIGVFPTLELLEHRPGEVLKILLSSRSSENTGIQKIMKLCERNNTKVVVSDNLVNKISGKENSFAVGVFRKFISEVHQGENHLVLVGIRDMGNLGTICRTMLGFNLNNLVIIKPAADIFDPKTIRASMGAIFQLDFQYFNTFEDYKKAFSNNNYPFMTDGKTELPNVKFAGPYSLIFGSEPSGLDESFQNIGTSVKIPQSNKIDSLNLSIATGIALYEAQKK